ncbi:MAG: hypothetical protein DWQ09_08750 [Proteobacteria bacterium]|nr:MAG: hypothetical protein DWQ09_08750 [Pseudomonadota bacterium]
MMFRFFAMPTLLILAITSLLTGCGPHPTAGEWVATTDTPAAYARIQIEFDGKAYLFVPEREDHQVRCFWSSFNRTTIDMDCIRNDPSERRLNYRLGLEDEATGTLTESGAHLGRYRRR